MGQLEIGKGAHLKQAFSQELANEDRPVQPVESANARVHDDAVEAWNLVSGTILVCRVANGALDKLLRNSIYVGEIAQIELHAKYVHTVDRILRVVGRAGTRDESVQARSSLADVLAKDFDRFPRLADAAGCRNQDEVRRKRPRGEEFVNQPSSDTETYAAFHALVSICRAVARLAPYKSRGPRKNRRTYLRLLPGRIAAHGFELHPKAART